MTFVVQDVCAKVSRHTKCPTGYSEWQEWARRKMKTHRQVVCPACGLWTIWVKKTKRTEAKARFVR